MTMRTQVRNACVRLIDALGASALYRALVRRRGPLTRVVVFHDVPDAEWFSHMLDTIGSTSHVLTPEAFVRGERDPDRLNTLITFDDGYASWMHVALPALRARGYRAIFFVNTGLLDAAPSPREAETFMRERLMLRPRAPLTWEGAASLRENGHTIGGHTRTHAHLGRTHGDLLGAEIRDDRSALREHLGVVPTEFAYPFGTPAHVTPQAVDAVRAAGYLRAYTAVSGFVPAGETFLIPRMCIESALTPRELTRWLMGAYDLFDMMKRLCVR